MYSGEEIGAVSTRICVDDEDEIRMYCYSLLPRDDISDIRNKNDLFSWCMLCGRLLFNFVFTEKLSDNKKMKEYIKSVILSITQKKSIYCDYLYNNISKIFFLLIRKIIRERIRLDYDKNFFYIDMSINRFENLLKVLLFLYDYVNSNGNDYLDKYSLDPVEWMGILFNFFYTEESIDSYSFDNIIQIIIGIVNQTIDHLINIENREASPMVISGYTGEYENIINGLFVPYIDKLGGDGRVIYVKDGDPNTWLEHAYGDWGILNKKDDKSLWYGYVRGCCGLKDCASRKWNVYDGETWVDAPLMKIVTEDDYIAEKAAVEAKLMIDKENADTSELRIYYKQKGYNNIRSWEINPTKEFGEDGRVKYKGFMAGGSQPYDVDVIYNTSRSRWEIYNIKKECIILFLDDNSPLKDCLNKKWTTPDGGDYTYITHDEYYAYSEKKKIDAAAAAAEATAVRAAFSKAKIDNENAQAKHVVISGAVSPYADTINGSFTPKKDGDLVNGRVVYVKDGDQDTYMIYDENTDEPDTSKQKYWKILTKKNGEDIMVAYVYCNTALEQCGDATWRIRRLSTRRKQEEIYFRDPDTKMEFKDISQKHETTDATPPILPPSAPIIGIGGSSAVDYNEKINMCGKLYKTKTKFKPRTRTRARAKNKTKIKSKNKKYFYKKCKKKQTKKHSKKAIQTTKNSYKNK